jgi:cytoskeleton protein RodZ
METRIGEVLRETRRRRETELAEVEAATRIRPRYLRAIEAEEWDALPGGVYTRGFIRTYASFLGLDGERLAEDYRETVEGASREWPLVQDAVAPAKPAGTARRRRAGGRRLPAPGWLAAAAVIAVAVLAIVALPGGGGESGSRTGAEKRSNPGPAAAKDAGSRAREVRSGVSMRLAANAEVWVCLLDANGRRLVDGQILEGGAEAGPFRSDSFTVSFGNGEVSMTIDGQEAEISPTSSPVGYAIDATGRLSKLSESERPTCT